MKTPYIAFLKNLLIFSLVIVVICIGLSYLLPESYFSPVLPFLFPFYIATTLISYHFMLKSLHRRFSKFVNRFMAATAIKLLWYLMVMVLYILFFTFDAIPFAINFFIFYLCYTVFETVSLVRYSKSYVNKSPPNQT
ncbi:MAG: hypothetical protein ISR57_03740 [Bacteroidales bacterium]|nr:hypothetical protein [Bacteroidota bacterium]MBL6949737.1 hypothetical protein [Bacteroidales bacterium]